MMGYECNAKMNTARKSPSDTWRGDKHKDVYSVFWMKSSK